MPCGLHSSAFSLDDVDREKEKKQNIQGVVETTSFIRRGNVSALKDTDEAQAFTGELEDRKEKKGGKKKSIFDLIRAKELRGE